MAFNTAKQAKTFTLRASMNAGDTTSHKLSRLVQGLPALNVVGSLDKDIAALAFDSRQAGAGSLFVAIPGFKQDGGRFIGDAIQRGATAFITELSVEALRESGLTSNAVTAICVDDSRQALAKVSAEFFQHPSRKLDLIGVTGTNGKTTLTYVLESIFNTRGETTGVIGTINCRYGDVALPASVTTPESLDLNRMLHAMAENNVAACFMEVSSHALHLKRVHGMHFKTGVFTNLSRDHLDFHGSMQEYKEAKKGLFRDNHVERMVINIDDPAGREFAQEATMTVLTTGIDHAADVAAENVALSANNTRFTLKTPSGSREIHSKLLGKHNVHNLLSAAGAALLQNFSLDEIQSGLETLERVPGRFERIEGGQPFTVAVDYAHTDDALANALSAARAFTQNRVIVVFGCGGDRDRGKRKEMGKAALALSDLAIVTSDNPRTEDPMRILDDIVQGLPASAKENEDYRVLPDRREAIEYAVNLAEAGDLVLIAGKGHEDYQILGTEKIHFDDREVAAEALAQKYGAR